MNEADNRSRCQPGIGSQEATAGCGRHEEVENLQPWAKSVLAPAADKQIWPLKHHSVRMTLVRLLILSFTQLGQFSSLR